MKFKCCYANDKEGTDRSLVIESVEALNTQEAAKKFDSDNGATLVRPYICVQWGGLLEKGSCEIFESQKWPIWQREEEEKKREGEEKERKEHEDLMQSYKKYTEDLRGISFLEMSTEKRDAGYNKTTYLSSELEKRPLYKEEIEFLKAWHQLKDREIGEQLLTKHEMSKPQSEQGKSAFGNWGKVLALQGMVAQNTLNEIADDVGDISDDGGGFD